MTTDDGRPDVPGEIESLERIVQSCLENLRGTPHLHGDDDARAFLEELADRCREAAPRGAAVERAASSRRLSWPSEPADADRHATVVRLVADTGIAGVDEDEDEVRFTDNAAQDYLAAHHLFRRHPRGPRWWSPRTRKYLAPRQTWPWPDAEVLMLLTALWRRDATDTVDRRLRRLLRHRHRNPNLRFVVELVRRGLLPGSDLRDRTAGILREELADGGQDDAHWAAMVESLRLLDPVMAADELENVVRSPSPTMTSLRRVAAAAELVELDPARGVENLRIVGDSLSGGIGGSPRDRLDAALRIAELNAEVGARTMRLLAHTRELGDLRADAAIHEGSPGMLLELMEPAHALSDDARLRLSRRGRAPRPGPGAGDGGRARLARASHGRQPGAAVRGPADRAVRAGAGPTRPAPPGRGPVRDRRGPGPRGDHDHRAGRADHLVGRARRGPHPGPGVPHRGGRGRRAGRPNHRRAVAPRPLDDLLTHEHRAAGAPAQGVRARPRPGRRRDRRVRQGHARARDDPLRAGRARRRDAGPATDRRPVLGHRRGTGVHHRREGRQEGPGAGHVHRATPVGRHRRTSRRQLEDPAEGGAGRGELRQARPGDARGLRPAGHRAPGGRQGLVRPRSAGRREGVADAGRASRTGDLRIDAARALPDAVRALVAIAGDRREKDTLRREAALRARDLDRGRGRQALVDLSEARGISQSVRDKLARDLDR